MKIVVNIKDMLHHARKFVCLLLAFVLLLVPIEFVVAHDAMMPVQQADQLVMQDHAESQHHHAMYDETTEHDCDGQNVCNDCVFCSPALNFIFQAEVDKPLAVKLPADTFTQNSIGLPVAYRPPRQL